MKIVYCLINSSPPDEMVRSICCKADYLADVLKYDVTIITTDNHPENSFRGQSEKVNYLNLNINYFELRDLPSLSKLNTRIKKRRIHKKELSRTLKKIKPDVTISTHRYELSILYNIKKAGRKIAEIHLNENEYIEKSRFSLSRIFRFLRNKKRQKILRKFDSVVVETKADEKRWGNLPNIEVIANVVPFYPNELNNTKCNKQVISVGELNYLNENRLLIDAWSNVFAKHNDWALSIFSNGGDESKLTSYIAEKRLEDVVSIQTSINNLEDKYLNSAFYIVSSRSKEFSLNLIQAMAYGLPCISANSTTNVADIITHGEDGLLVEAGNMEKLTEAILFLIEDKELRIEMGENARENVHRFLPDRIMQQWVRLFEQITGTSGY